MFWNGQSPVSISCCLPSWVPKPMAQLHVKYVDELNTCKFIYHGKILLTVSFFSGLIAKQYINIYFEIGQYWCIGDSHLIEVIYEHCPTFLFNPSHSCPLALVAKWRNGIFIVGHQRRNGIGVWLLRVSVYVRTGQARNTKCPLSQNVPAAYIWHASQKHCYRGACQISKQ